MRRNRRKGSAVVEAALMMPWLAFLFVGVLDFGFYSYAAICTQNAARAAALASATGSHATPCTAALGELNGLPNMVGVTTCATYPSGASASQPSVCVATLAWDSTAGAGTNSDPLCSAASTCADCSLDASSSSIQATVTYQTLPMIPIPGILMGTMKLTRTAEMRVTQ